MHRRAKAVLAVVVLCVAGAVFETYLLTHADGGPSSEEFQVYGAFLTRFATDRGLRPNELALERETLQLTDPQFESWVPIGLRHGRMFPPPEFVSFCGTLCGRDFVKKNLAMWQLKPSVQGELGVFIVEASESTQTAPPKSVVDVTRVGFDLRGNRAVLMYSFDCNDYSPNRPVLCVQIGNAYLQKRKGTWNVDHYSGLTL
jgi:hypothetical protein